MPMNLTVFKGLLKQTKIQIDTSESGKECLDKMKETVYDMIFLDHQMPEMDGIETRKHMDTLEGNKNVGIPVIALTANAVSGAREIYIANGFTDYLTKPIDTIALEKMLVQYIPEEKVMLIEENVGGNAELSGMKDVSESEQDEAVRYSEEELSRNGKDIGICGTGWKNRKNQGTS